MSNKTITDEIYQESADLGRGMSEITMYILVVFGIILFFIGVYTFFTKPEPDPDTGKTPNNKINGISFMIFGLILISVGYVSKILVYKYKFLAAGTGFRTVYGLFQR